jgi:hypothetical protein
MIPENDGSNVGGWASSCEDRPDAVDCIWHSSKPLGTIQVVPTGPCSYPTGTCGDRAATCFKVPAAAKLAATRCDAPVLYAPGVSHATSDAGCVACSCKALGLDPRTGFMSMQIGQQYCTDGFFVNGTLDQRHTGTYVVTGNFCNGKPVFRMARRSSELAYGVQQYDSMAPVLFQPTGTDIWAIDAGGWDHSAVARAAGFFNVNAHEDQCLLVNSTALSSADTNGCSTSPDCASGWAEEGRPNPKLRVQPLHNSYLRWVARHRNNS